MYPLQLEKYIPFWFSRFLTVKKKRMARTLFSAHVKSHWKSITPPKSHIRISYV